MPTPHLIVFGYVLPALLPLAGVLIAWFLSRRPAARSAFAGLGAAGALLAFVVGFRVASELTTWRPAASSDAAAWAYYAAAALAVAALADGALRPPAWLRAGVLLFAVRVLLRLILTPLYGRSLTPDVAEGWVDGLALAVLVNVLAIDALTARWPVSGTLVAATLAIGWSAFLLTATHNIRAGFVAASAVGAYTATACGAAIVYALDARAGRARRASDSEAASSDHVAPPVAGMASLGLLFAPLLLLAAWGFFYQPDDAPPRSELACGAALLVAPLAAFAGDVPGVRRWGSRWRGLVRLLVVGAIVAAAAGTCVHVYNHPPAGSGGEGGYEGE